MKIRDQCVDNVKFIPRAEIETRDTFVSHDPASLARDPLKRACAGRPNGYDATTRQFCTIDFLCRLRIEPISLALHPMIFDVGIAHRLKGTRPDMQGQLRALDAPVIERRSRLPAPAAR